MNLKTLVTLAVVVGMFVPTAAAVTAQTQSTPAPAEPVADTTDAQPSDTAADTQAEEDNESSPARLYIQDRWRGMELKPGESDSFEVTVENGDEETVTLNPSVFVPEFTRSRPVKPAWTTISVSQTELAPDEEATVTVNVSVPSDAELANYHSTIALTNATVAYGDRPERPAHSIDFSLDVYREPTVEIVDGDWLHAPVQAGETVTRNVTIENSGDEAVPLNPQANVQDHHRYYGSEGQLDRSWIEFDAPSQIEAGETETVTITVSVPESADRGRYNTEIDLGLRDPHRSDDNRWWQQVNLNLRVWQQPTDPFTTTVDVDNETDTLTLTLSEFSYRTQSTEDGEFEVTFVTPDGEVITPERVQEKQTGAVSLAEGDERRGQESDGPYSSDSGSETVTVQVEDPEAGEWEVRILPRNVLNFQYEIVEEMNTDDGN
jgi:hypothetical protein